MNDILGKNNKYEWIYIWKKWTYSTLPNTIATIFLFFKYNDLYYYLSSSGINRPVVLVKRKEGMFKKYLIAMNIYKFNVPNLKGIQIIWSADIVGDTNK